MKLVRQDQRFFINFFDMGDLVWFFPAMFLSSTCSEIRFFSHPSTSRTSSNCLSHRKTASGWPKNRSRGTNGSSMFAHDYVHLCRGRRIRIHGHLDFGILGASSIFTWASADTAWAVCPSQSGWLAMTSITFAAVICDADEPLFRDDCIGSRVVFYIVTSDHDSSFLLLKLLVLTPHFWDDRCPSM